MRRSCSSVASHSSAEVGSVDARRDLVARQVAETEQQVVDAVGMARRALGREVLELELELGERIGVEQLAQLGLAEERRAAAPGRR